MSKTFLEAEWRKLAMANYEVDAKMLKAFVPHKTELDLWNNICYVSLVGFKFQNTRIKGFRIPFHTDFEEVNLRFYVRFKDRNEWKRGVVFIREIVPKPALTFVANTVYKEKYKTMRMQHSWKNENDQLQVEYKWKKKGNWNSIHVTSGRTLNEIKTESEEEFITEHYWGYTKTGEQKTAEYGVEHPRWQVYTTLDHKINVDFGVVYGSEFAFLSDLKPKSVFLAEGSVIKVMEGRTL